MKKDPHSELLCALRIIETSAEREKREEGGRMFIPITPAVSLGGMYEDHYFLCLTSGPIGVIVLSTMTH